MTEVCERNLGVVERCGVDKGFEAGHTSHHSLNEMRLYVNFYNTSASTVMQLEREQLLGYEDLRF
jgi:hypothetical protein